MLWKIGTARMVVGVVGAHGRGRGRIVHHSAAVELPAVDVVVLPECPPVMLRSAAVVDFNYDDAARPKKKERLPKSEYKRAQKTSAPKPFVPCGCANQCITLLGASAAANRSKFESKRDWGDASQLLASIIEVHRVMPDNGKFRFKYRIPDQDGVGIIVCRVAFKSVFGIGNTRLTNLLKRMTNRYGNDPADGVPPDFVDGRGKSNVVVVNRVPLEILALAKASIASQITESGETSHFVLEDYPDTIFMPCDQSVQTMWMSFLREHDRPTFDMIETCTATATPLPAAFAPVMTKRRFEDLFSKECGYVRFYKPKTDECKTCLQLQTHMDALPAAHVAWPGLVQDLHDHRRNAQLGYRMIEHKSSLARLSREQYPLERTKWVDTLTFDQMKKFDVPHLLTKQARFGHQLSVFNLGIYSAHTDNHSFFLWSEWDGSCGADETISILLQFFEANKDTLGSGILNMICDSCGGQNKNRFMIAFCAELARPGSQFHRFAEVNLMFPEVGHTFLPNDRIFGVIAQHVKKANYYEPRELLPLVKASFNPARPQSAVWMDRLEFKNYGEHMDSMYAILQAKELGGDAHQPANKLALRDEAKWINFGRSGKWSHPKEIWVMNTLNSNDVWNKFNVYKPHSQLVPLRSKYPAPLRLDAVKMQSLFDLSASIPSSYRHLYPAPDRGELADATAAVANMIQAKNRQRHCANIE